MTHRRRPATRFVSIASGTGLASLEAFADRQVAAPEPEGAEADPPGAPQAEETTAADRPSGGGAPDR